MKKRHEKGIILILMVIIICFLLMYLIEKGPFSVSQKETRYNNSITLQNSRSIENNDVVLEEDISVADSESTDMQEEEDLWILFDELQFERKGSRIQTMGFSILLILYVVLIGPILYFLLKKKDKMEWMWGLMAICAISFAGVILFWGDTVSMKKALVDALTVVTPGQEDRVYLSMTSPGRDAYTITFNDTVREVAPLYLTGEYRLTENGVMRETQEYTLNQEGGTMTLQMQPGEAFSQDYFRLTLEDVHSGKIEGNLKNKGEYLAGTLKNDTQWDFSNVMLFYGENYCVITEVHQETAVIIRQEDWKQMADEDVWTGPGKYALSKKGDQKRILNFAYFRYYSSEVYGSQLCFAGVIENHDSGVKDVGADIVSHGLFYQLSEIK